MEPNSPFQMQFYDQGHGNANGFPPNYSQSPGMSSPNNSLSSQTPPYGYRGMENGMSRFMPDQFDSQSFQQHPNQYYQQQQNMRRNDPSFPFKNQLGSQQGFQNQQGNYVGSRDSFSSANYNSFLPSNMKGRMPSESDMFPSSAQSFSQGRQNFTTSSSRDPFGNQMQMGMMDGGMSQQNQLMSQMQGQVPEYPPQYQQFQNRNEFGRNQFYGPDAGFRSNGLRPDGFGQAFSQSQSPQTPTQGPMDQRATSMYSPVGPGYPVNQAKNMNNNPSVLNENQRQAAIMAAAAVRAAAAASSRPGREFPPGTGYPNTYQYGPRGYIAPDVMGSPFNNTGNGIQSPPTKDFPPASPLGPNIPRQTANFADSPMSQGRGSANSVPFSPSVEQGGFASPGFGGQRKVPTTSPSVMKKSPSSDVLKQNISPSSCESGSAEVKIKHEANVVDNCASVQDGDSNIDSNLDENALNDAEELLKNAEERAVDEDVIVKKESELEDQKASIDESVSEDKTKQEEGEKSLLSAPASKSSAPPTPLSGISPSSSPFPDDLDLASISPSWPNTPTSPSAKRLLQSRSPARFDQLSKLYDLSEDDERRTFLDKYLAFMSVNGTPITKVPIVCKQPLDLYRLFRAVLMRGGLQEVMKKKQFREVLKSIDLASTNASLAYTVKNQYTKYLLPFENKMKDSFLRAWQKDSQVNKSAEKPVPTIVLNDTLPSAQQMSKIQQMATTGMGQDSGLRDWQMPVPDASNQFQVNSQMQMSMSQNNVMSNAMSMNQTRPAYPGRTSSYVNTPDMNSGYPMNSFMRFQRPGFQRNQNQAFAGGQGFPTTMQQNPMQNPLSPSWPRNFPQRPLSGPPELFPEGLQRSPWSQPQQGMNRGQHPQAYMTEKQQRLSNKIKSYQSSMKDQNSPWPTNKGPNIPLKPKRSSTPVTGEQTSQTQKSSIHSALKREPLVFPVDSVENTKPVINKRPKLTSKELGPVEAWRIMMSLKSGMLAECTWAVDTLNILLHDDKTISYFHLPQLPGLLDTLMDHFRRCCMDAFDILKGIEAPMQIEKELSTAPTETQGLSVCKKARKEVLNELWVGVVKHAKSSYSGTIASQSVFEGEEDVCDLTESIWKTGGGDDTSHIQLSFPARAVDRRMCTSHDSESNCTVKEKIDLSMGTSTEALKDEDRKEESDEILVNGSDSAIDGETDGSSNFLDGKCGDTSKNKAKRKILDACTKLNHVDESLQKKFVASERSYSACESEKTSEKLDADPKANNHCNVDTDKNVDSLDESPDNCRKRSLSNSDVDTAVTIDEKLSETESEKKTSVHLEAYESFKAMEYLENGLNEPKAVLDAVVEELCTSLELDTDYTKQYLETSKEFIGYLKNRLTAENRGKVPSQEAFAPENSPFCVRSGHEESIFGRLIAVSNIFRSLSFVSGNDNDLANHPGLLLLMGKLLIYRHDHPVTDHSEFRLTQEDSDTESCGDGCDSYTQVCLEGLRAVRENILVILANVAGQMDLSRYPEHIILPLLDGLLHWVVCQSSEARDPMPTAPSKYALSPKRLALETLAKLSITDNNVDLILATPPVSRLKGVFKELVKAIGIKSSIPVREFAVVVLDNLSHGDNIIASIIEQKSCIGNILLFLEEAEKNTSSYVSGGGVVQPGLSAEDVCGTSVNMLRRAADILLCLARGVIDKSPFLPYVHRLLSLATSQMMDTSVLKILSEIMYELR